MFRSKNQSPVSVEWWWAGGAYMWQRRVASLSVATGGLASVILHQGPPSDEMHPNY